MIDLDAALAIIAGVARPLGSETVALQAAGGRILSAPVVAGLAAPRQDVSAMDGYAVREQDLQAGGALKVVGASYPGRAFAGALPAGGCVRIFTGAPVPAGADRVVVQEIVASDGSGIRLLANPSKARHIRAQGSDFRSGAALLPAGRALGFREMVVTAAADVAMVEVWRRPRVSIVTTGDELTEPGAAAKTPTLVPDSLLYGIAAFVTEWGGVVSGAIRCPDDLEKLSAAAFSAAAEADLVVIAGGASVGERDFSRTAFARTGMELLFEKVAIKPGKPVWFGKAGHGLVLGLPGNPTSALVTARLFLAPLLAGLAGLDPAAAIAWDSAPLGQELPACAERETLVRGRRVDGQVWPVTNQDSGAQLALAETDVLIRRPRRAPAINRGGMAPVLCFQSVLQRS